MTSYGLNTDQIINIEVKHMSEIEEKIILEYKEMGGKLWFLKK